MQEYNFMDPTEDTLLKQPLRRTHVQDNNEQQSTDVIARSNAGAMSFRHRGMRRRSDEAISTYQDGFVSTNSISQGEQVGILWNELVKKVQR